MERLWRGFGEPLEKLRRGSGEALERLLAWERLLGGFGEAREPKMTTV